MPRLFVPAEQINGQQVEITDEDAHYLMNVLRLGVGDSFEVVAPTAAEYTVAIEHTEAELVIGQIRKQQHWQKIARQAAQQSERMKLPTVKPAVSLSEALTDWQQSKTPGLVFSARTSRDKAHRLRQALARLGKTAELSLFIGPKGGFTAQ